ncbi:pyrimidine 5'-nucleotidase [Thalassotalea aquiviva]|uniref:pyrimidine 5'-nucleotidase n=1 Tax=Thalassotalea aquiviva TaxID=3242415 RepID=UPI00352A5946
MLALQQRDVHLYDLDNTLYHPKNQILEQIGARMRYFLSQQLNITLAQANQLCEQYYLKYGGSGRGVQLHHPEIDLEEFAQYSHDVDLRHVQPDQRLNLALSNCSKTRYVFTNSPNTYATRVLQHLGLYEYFEGVFSVELTDYKMKPDPHAFQTICQHFNFAANNAVMYDDQPLNLETARGQGMRTVLVNRDDLKQASACYRTNALADFVEKMNHIR